MWTDMNEEYRSNFISQMSRHDSIFALTETDRSNGPITRDLTEIMLALEDFMIELNGARDSRRDDRSILGNWLTDCQPWWT